MDAERKATWRSLKDADVVVSTCIGAMSDALISNSVVNASTVPDGAEPFRFRTVLIDEASQCAEPGALVPLLVGAEQLILIGDQNQLPPTVLSKEAAQGGLHVSLFERCQVIRLPRFLKPSACMLLIFFSFHQALELGYGGAPADAAVPYATVHRRVPF
eukprot:scaffold8079_cov267-Pinguiococcus_pyrenoidosus.AAC.2